MGLRWEEGGAVWHGWEGDYLAARVLRYERSEMRVVDGTGLRRSFTTGSFWIGSMAGDRVEGEYETPAEAAAAVDAAHHARQSAGDARGRDAGARRGR